MKKTNNIILGCLFMALVISSFAQPVFADPWDTVGNALDLSTTSVFEIFIGTDAAKLGAGSGMEIFVLFAFLFLTIYGFLEILRIFPEKKSVSFGLAGLLAFLGIRTLATTGMLMILVEVLGFMGGFGFVGILVLGVGWSLWGWHQEKKHMAKMKDISGDMNLSAIKKDQSIFKDATHREKQLQQDMNVLRQEMYDLVKKHGGKAALLGLGSNNFDFNSFNEKSEELKEKQKELAELIAFSKGLKKDADAAQNNTLANMGQN